jgi:hypothetical protein
MNKPRKTKQISLQEYAGKIDPSYFRANRKNPNSPITQSAVKYRVKHNLDLPLVLKYKKVGKIHVLTVNTNF